jgi:hypothetical protein
MMPNEQGLVVSFKQRLIPYVPGIILFIAALLVNLATYQDYGITWDEGPQRAIGTMTYDYIFKGSRELYGSWDMYHGSGFELPLVLMEKCLKLTDTRDIYLMRHLVTNTLFLISALAMYVLAYRLFRNKFIACLGFLMLLLMPRIYAHSFFNTKDIPFLSMLLISLCYSQIAFEQNKKWMFLLLGALCGYTTSIRVMGIMLAGFILLFLLFDLLFVLREKTKRNGIFLMMLLYLGGFSLTLYATWPSLWEHPIHDLIGSIRSLSRFPWHGVVLLNGKTEYGTDLPWTYFPIWFLITTPELWLICGFAGIVWIAVNYIKRPIGSLQNERERVMLLHFLCFFVPVIAVIFFHSVIYNDWRHLYFVYPSFIVMALYFIHKLLATKAKLAMQVISVLQLGLTSFFMVSNYPFNEVYFNYFVSHKEDYLASHYELDYWGACFKQGLDHVLGADSSKTVKVGSVYVNLLHDNMQLLPKDKRDRVQVTDMGNADYVILNYKALPGDFPTRKLVYSVQLLNSSILCVYK